MIDVLCIGTHPDDVEIAMGGTVAGMVRQGLRVALLDLTDGEPTPAGSPEVRRREAEAARVALGVPTRITLDLPNRSLADTPEARRAVAEVLRALRPRLLFGPYPVDAHPDHVAAATLVDAARFWAKLTRTDMAGEPHLATRVIHYGAVHLPLPVVPSFVVDVTPDYEAKRAALAAYASQLEWNPLNRDVPRRLEEQARYFGGLIRTTYGEPFFSREAVGIGSVAHLL
jgi:bacillithiol biosynthesis deacetylase BshB1